MVRFTADLLLFTAFQLASARPPSSDQHVLDIPHPQHQNPVSASSRKLHGKFLHITDIHPDPFYQQGSDPSGLHPCHRGRSNATGYFGAEKTECDSPFTLINATFDWIAHNIRDEIDFVVWTGDSARHDNDEDYPRTYKQVEQLNEFVVHKFDEVFGKGKNRHDRNPTNDFVVPIVPTFGNNDVLPHNVFTPGPNRWTRKYLTIWEKFVPQEQRHSFARGGWFYVEVIPNRLAVFSLNTLYFFDNNGAVDGCDNPHEPGYEHFEWLRIQLEFLRRRNVKAILTGHVPPARTASKASWDESCYQKYDLWLRQYRDVVVGNAYGHMNIDHFMLQDVRELSYKFRIKGIDDVGARDYGESMDDEVHVVAKSDYLSELRDLWGNLPSPPKMSPKDVNGRKSRKKKKKKKKKRKLQKYLKEIGGPYGERFSLSVISPSVVPNFYPTLRIVEYNITGLEHDHPASTPTAHINQEIHEEELEQAAPGPWSHIADLETDLSIDTDYREPRKKNKHRKPKPNFPVPNPPSKSVPPGPAYSPQALSWIGWRQLYANITKINELVARELEVNDIEMLGFDDAVQEEMLKKHFSFELEYDTRDKDGYHMKDLTMRNWLNLAEKIGRSSYSLHEKDSDQESPDSRDDDQEVNDDDSEEEAELLVDDEDGGDENVSITRKKRENGKKRKGQTLKKNLLWHVFVKRAFVGTKTDDELDDEFG